MTNFIRGGSEMGPREYLEYACDRKIAWFSPAYNSSLASHYHFSVEQIISEVWLINRVLPEGMMPYRLEIMSYHLEEYGGLKTDVAGGAAILEFAQRLCDDAAFWQSLPRYVQHDNRWHKESILEGVQRERRLAIEDPKHAEVPEDELSRNEQDARMMPDFSKPYPTDDLRKSLRGELNQFRLTRRTIFQGSVFRRRDLIELLSDPDFRQLLQKFPAGKRQSGRKHEWIAVGADPKADHDQIADPVIKILLACGLNAYPGNGYSVWTADLVEKGKWSIMITVTDGPQATLTLWDNGIRAIDATQCVPW